MKPIVAAAALALCAPALAQAQTAAPSGVYFALGYATTHTEGEDFGSIQGRLGYRFNNWLGVEGEAAGGVVGESTITRGTEGSVTFKKSLQHQEALYGVGFLPLSANFDLLARLGYGDSRLKSAGTTTNGAAPPLIASQVTQQQSWNYGLGAQYRWNAALGIRADYTREEHTGVGLNHTDVWSIAYVRTF